VTAVDPYVGRVPVLNTGEVLEELEFDFVNDASPDYAAGLQQNLKHAIAQGEAHAFAEARASLEAVVENAEDADESNFNEQEDGGADMLSVGSFQIDERQMNQSVRFLPEPQRSNQLEVQSQGPGASSRRSSPGAQLKMATRKNGYKDGHQWK
jgi:hypothetical protein